MPLSEHVYCVAITFKMTERVEQQICIKFCVKLEHSFTKTTWVIQKATAMGNWWLAASLQQHAHSCIMSCTECFWWNIKSPRWLNPTIAPILFFVTSGFSRLKSRLKGKKLQTTNEIQENTMGTLMAIGRTVWGPKVPTLKETEVSLSYAQCFLCLLQ